jgi:hypothetical protein
MSDAKLKCSNCGAELTNLTFGWGKRQWLWGVVGFLPLVAIVVWMQFWVFRPNHDFASEIQASLIETRVAKDRLDVLGELKNVGSHTWNRVTVEAEVYDKDGKFLDETSDYIAVALSPGAEEHFRLTFASPDDKISDETSKVVLKITDADDDRF